jgi:hypothetical protein
MHWVKASGKSRVELVMHAGTDASPILESALAPPPFSFASLCLVATSGATAKGNLSPV